MGPVIENRRKLYREIADLLAKPRRSRNDDIKLAQLQHEWTDSLLQVGRPSGSGGEENE
ncbi:MAG: hypothetical protein PHR41_09665 [Lactococcus chungangensis]|nr:hypothetical protein [Lactococcus chungangensis]